MTDLLSQIEILYSNMNKKNKKARTHFNRPLTYTEKILSLHMKNVIDEEGNKLKSKISYAQFYPDRIAMQDATAQMALLQFINSGKKKTSIPSTVHCDHLIKAKNNANEDLLIAKIENKEVYDFLESASKKYGLGFWKAGSGIIHQVVLENYAFPGGMIIGTDSHTPNAGGLGMIAIGVGGSDAVDVMAGKSLNLKWPDIIGVHLKGNLNGWTSAKDVILQLMSILTVNGGTGSVVEFFGDGCINISATGKATITNMGAEHGATTSIFPYDLTMKNYLNATQRHKWANLAEQYKNHLQADPEVYANPSKFYKKIIEINLNKLEPCIVGPHSPDRARTIKKMKKELIKSKFPSHPSFALIGSCTNSSYQDIGRAASLADFAFKNNLKIKMPLFITPGSNTTYSTIVRDKQAESLKKIGAIFLANACGPCIGQWHRNDKKHTEKNSIVSSYNRNFPARNDGNRKTLSFIASPEMVIAIALSGDLAFNPEIDTIKSENGINLKLPTPYSKDLPENGFQIDRSGFVKPIKNKEFIDIKIKSNSDRLCLLKRFSKFNNKDFFNMPILLKAKGKCTTDHISQAGIWLKFRGHLEKISDNTYLGATNAFLNKIGKGIDVTDNSEKKIKLLPEIAKSFKNRNISWAVIGDENFGEGSSREHAAMQPRYLGCKVIISRSFARIHETNLKKHGILPLTFKDSSNYEKIKTQDLICINDLKNIFVNKPIKIKIQHKNRESEIIVCEHTLSQNQISWFKAGSALNYISNNF